MYKSTLKNRRTWLILFSLTIMLLSGCSLFGGDEATPAETESIQPTVSVLPDDTSTISPTDSPTSASEPTSTQISTEIPPTTLPSSPPTNTSAPGVSLITVDALLNVRAGPSTDYSTVGRLLAGSTVPIIGRSADNSWWQVQFKDGADGRGWIAAEFGEVTNTEAIPVVGVSTPVSSEIGLLTTDVVLNVRSGPDTTYDALGLLAVDSTVKIIGKNTDSTWWQIEFEEAPEGMGWVSAEFGETTDTDNVHVVEFVKSTTEPGGASLTTDVKLNVRSGPDTTHAKLGLLEVDLTAKIVGKNEDGTWWQIEFEEAPEGMGWVSAEFGDATNTDDVPVVKFETTPTPDNPSVTFDIRLNARSGPDTNYKSYGILDADSTVAIIGRNEDSTWWQIAFEDAPDGKAWVSAEFGEAQDTDNVPVVEIPPSPTPAPATETPVPTSTQTQTLILIETPLPIDFISTNTPVPTKTPILTEVLTQTLVFEMETPTTTETSTTETPIPATETPIPATETPVSATETPIPATETPVPATETPISESSVSTPANFDFVVKEIKIWTNERNGGASPGGSVTNCGYGHEIHVLVIDKDGNPLDQIVIADPYNNPKKITGSHGPGRTQYILYGNGYELFVAEDHNAGREVSGETSSVVSAKDEEIPISWLMEGNYCATEEECQRRVSSNSLCRGHYSYDITFQRTW